MYRYGFLTKQWYKERQKLIANFTQKLARERELFATFFMPGRQEYGDRLDWELRKRWIDMIFSLRAQGDAMNFGMFTDFHVRQNMSQAEAFDESFRQVEEAEKLGIDSVWLSEHHFSPERSVLASPLVIASSIATRTQKVRIGLAVQVLPLTNPLRIAEEAATVDHISKGRFDFGVGRSGLTRYYQGYNVPYVESRSRFLEALDIITKAWTQEQFSYTGDHFNFHNVTVVPRPIKNPTHPSAWPWPVPRLLAWLGRWDMPFSSAPIPLSPSCKSAWPCIGKHARRQVTPVLRISPCAFPPMWQRPRSRRAQAKQYTCHSLRRHRAHHHRGESRDRGADTAHCQDAVRRYPEAACVVWHA